MRSAGICSTGQTGLTSSEWGRGYRVWTTGTTVSYFWVTHFPFWIPTTFTCEIFGKFTISGNLLCWAWWVWSRNIHGTSSCWIRSVWDRFPDVVVGSRLWYSVALNTQLDANIVGYFMLRLHIKFVNYRGQDYYFPSYDQECIILCTLIVMHIPVCRLAQIHQYHNPCLHDDPKQP